MKTIIVYKEHPTRSFEFSESPGGQSTIHPEQLKWLEKTFDEYKKAQEYLEKLYTGR